MSIFHVPIRNACAFGARRCPATRTQEQEKEHCRARRKSERLAFGSGRSRAQFSKSTKSAALNRYPAPQFQPRARSP